MSILGSESSELGLRCLIIAPMTFYSFHKTLASGLEARGYDVEMINEEFPANVWGKILARFSLPMLRFSTLIGLKARLKNRGQFDLIIIIKGRGLGPLALKYLRGSAKRIVGYNFDSFDFNPSPMDWHHLTDFFATFDIDDANTHNLPLVHLFSAAQPPSEGMERNVDLSILQRVHSDRLLYAAKLIDALPSGARAEVFLLESSKVLFILRFIRHPLLYLKLWPYVSFTPLTYEKAMQTLAKSRVTFDFAHPKQTGITIRCFEAQSLGTAIITNNKAAVESGQFSSESIAFLPLDATKEMICQKLTSLFNKIPQPIARTLDDFLYDLLEDIPELKKPATKQFGDF